MSEWVVKFAHSNEQVYLCVWKHERVYFRCVNATTTDLDVINMYMQHISLQPCDLYLCTNELQQVSYIL